MMLVLGRFGVLNGCVMLLMFIRNSLWLVEMWILLLFVLLLID